MISTKQRILKEALNLFSKNGYEAVSVEQIATAVGIKAPSLYKHYKSKKDIFDSILEKMNQMDYERNKEYNMPEGTFNEMAEEYSHISLEKIMQFSDAQFLHWTEDEFASSFRRMLLIEQFKNNEISEIYSKYLVLGPIEYMKNLFSIIVKNEEIGQQLALDYYSPIYLMFSLYDSSKVEKEEIIKMLHKHVEAFSGKLESFLK